MIPLCDFQRIDPSNDLVEPWLTHGAMDEIKTWDLSNKKVLEYGAGHSTIWWGDKCKQVYSIETNYEWWANLRNIVEMRNYDVSLVYRNVNEGDQTKIDFYTDIPEWFTPDIVVVDGVLRYECILKALTFPRPLILIVDNWQQDRIFICPSAEDALQDFKGKIYVQPDHKDHEGRPWATGIWTIE